MKNEIFISYAWGDDQEPHESREVIVDLIYDKLLSLGMNIIRDKKDLGYKGNIREFEDRIGAGNYIILVVSDKFLRSKHCMYEVLKISEHEDMYERIFPVVLSDARIYDKEDVLKIYINYWHRKTCALEEAIRQAPSLSDIPSVHDELRTFVAIERLLDRFTNMLSQMNTLVPEIHKETDFSALRKALQEQMKIDVATAHKIDKPILQDDRHNKAMDTLQRDQTDNGHSPSFVVYNYGTGDVVSQGVKNETHHHYGKNPSGQK
ncbi:toll/interleukin-1 receptor domain-containing protein [Chitinophaga sp. S165]|uniref:toll/interleukin-1 receptor domain-containing protein n=1 Tax=Chitinophaga sp. S165 TaxID=2135462 RepID=UPI000D71111C|nr:toll/interleukin-1 receptor domain-containing protein [Chitinophaga sp. S165]PWV45831.1 TIR domain-containing protein [Chitinophaga sp. S165]